MIRLTAIAIVLSLIPWPAWANAGIGYFILALPIVVMALLPVILLEACVLAPLLPVPIARALVLSFGANVRSMLWGLGLAVVADIAHGWGEVDAGPAFFDPTKSSVTGVLLPMFFLSWLIECRLIIRRASDLPPKRIAIGTGIANLLSYGAMIGFAWSPFGLPSEGEFVTRARINEAFILASALTGPIEDFWTQHKQFPTEIRQLGDPVTTGIAVAAIELRQGGIIAVTMKRHELWPDGGEITLTPTEDATAKTLSWKCRSNLPPKRLPRSCRE